MLSLTVFTSSPLPLPLLPALGPEVITVCLHTDSNEPMETYSGSLSDHSTFDFWTSLLSFMVLMIPTCLPKTTGGRQDNPTTRACWFSNPHRNVTLSPLYIPLIRHFIKRSSDQFLRIIYKWVHDNMRWRMRQSVKDKEIILNISVGGFIQNITIACSVIECRIFENMLICAVSYFKDILNVFIFNQLIKE